ncbi:MAG: ATP-binding protein [candidate division WOR-3 bacterium]|nr:ATP-binding protein [candidate division WOR-3 bacterium]
MKYPAKISRVSGLIVLHPFIVAFILLTSYPPLYREPNPSWYLIIMSVILAVAFLLLRRIIPENTLLYTIFFSDIPLVGAVIHYTGGIESMFPLLYAILILASSIYLYKRGAYIISLTVALFFLGLVFVESRGIEGYTASMVMYRFYVFALLFLLMGILSGGLSESYLRRVEEATRLRLTTEDIIKNLPSGVITVDSKGDILYSNIGDSRLRATVHLHVARFLKDRGTRKSIELKFGNRYYVVSYACIFKGKAGLAILQDMTEIRKLEENARITSQTKLLAELGGSLAHEIRNPLSSIRGSLEVIRDTKRRKSVAPFIDIALKETKRLNEIVTDFLNFSQFTPKNKNRVMISEVISEAILGSMLRTNERKLNVKRKDADFFVLADLNKLKSGFTNIINNAYEVSKKDGTIEIITSQNTKFGRVEIRDHGGGMKKQDLKKIFEPFFTTKKGGTGLGLAIAKNIIEAHGGSIVVRSRFGTGTTFSVRLPLA